MLTKIFSTDIIEMLTEIFSTDIIEMLTKIFSTQVWLSRLIVCFVE